MFYKDDTRITQILLNVYEHLKIDYDYVLVVVGDTGTGKSHFALNLFESWYDLILKKNVSSKMVSQVTTDYGVWLNNFKFMSEFDMNIYDEGATVLDSKNHASKISKDIKMLYNVFRAKKFFTVIVLPSFWDLDKYFRERRIRGLVWINKRGEYKFFSKTGIEWLNAYNERRYVKSMWGAYPVHSNSFPEYKGDLLKQYTKDKFNTIDGVLDNVISSSKSSKRVDKVTVVDIHKKDVLSLLKKGYTHEKIRKELGLSGSGLTRCVNTLKLEGLHP